MIRFSINEETNKIKNPINAPIIVSLGKWHPRMILLSCINKTKIIFINVKFFGKKDERITDPAVWFDGNDELLTLSWLNIFGYEYGLFR